MRLGKYFTMAMGVLVLAAGAMACDSSGGGTPIFTDTTGGTDTTETGDTVAADDTTAGEDTTSTVDDTTTGEDTSTVEDTSTENDTTQTVERQCTDEELEAFNTCAEACSGDQTCQSGCFNSELSAACKGAYQSWATCMDTYSCEASDTECIATNCYDQTIAVFGSGPEPSDCNPVADTGCESDETCTLVTQTETGCAPKGTAGYGEDCQSVGCAQGACLTFDGSSYECLEFCDPQNNTCREDRPCNIGAQGTDLTFCGDIPVSCDVFAQDCDGGKGCYVIDSSGNTDCAASQNKQVGESCQYLNDCAPGLICAGQPSACATICQTDGDPTGCATGEQCASLGVQNIGACVTQ